MIECCTVIYNPGFGGNFITKLLSLSKETVPYLYKNIANFSDLEVEDLLKISVQERYEAVEYLGIETHHNWHFPEKIVEPAIFYENKKVDDFFSWSILRNHFTCIRPPRINYVKKIIFLELDLLIHKDWIVKAGPVLGATYLLTDQAYAENEKIKQELSERFPVHNLSMTNFLASENGFVKEYTNACRFLEITPEIEFATRLYRDWYKFRYLHILNK